jgi:di/tripeptidase
MILIKILFNLDFLLKIEIGSLQQKQHLELVNFLDDLTLDDGAGISGSLALIIDKSVSHGPLELLFTTEEETGLVGALNLKNENNFLNGTILLNVDSGTEGQLTIGCAGGQSFESVKNIEI